jgi:hypothetical protein
MFVTVIFIIQSQYILRQSIILLGFGKKGQRTSAQQLERNPFDGIGNFNGIGEQQPASFSYYILTELFRRLFTIGECVEKQGG